MIKCPKCSFEQPEDIYCANCGVNMKTFKPAAGSFLKAFLSSWMGKIALITLLIIAALIYDWQKSRNDPPELSTSDVARQVPKSSADYEPMAPNDSPPVNPAPETSTSSARMNSPANSARLAVAKKALAEEKAAAEASTAIAPTPATPPVLKVSFYSASRNAIQELQRESYAASLSEGLGGVFPQKKIATLSSEMKSLASSRYKVNDPQKPVIIYKGQRTPELKMGVYFQITPLRQEAGMFQFEVKSWGHIKAQETDDSLFTTEITMNAQQAAFVTSFLPRDKTLTDEEKQALEGDPTLRIYNQEDFIDGSTDLIMIIEMATAP